ncbi:multi antimicrobial extrusion protein [Artemisia annua]|uniref:Multi antimicrobial extrusion protein n=1 Tax=Artemisia annua TaxID=35608 RepID=A0A2U1L3H8_ARTAN|nr:multi antimicrobial extrusion protein [Artemisia annua]
MAAFQICLQVWFTSSLLSDGLAVAGQAIIASSFAERNYEKATTAASRVLQMGFVLGLGVVLLIGLGLQFGSGVFTKDIYVQRIISIGIPILVSSLTIGSLFGLYKAAHFIGIWTALTIFMRLRAIVGIWMGTGTGPWPFLRKESVLDTNRQHDHVFEDLKKHETNRQAAGFILEQSNVNFRQFWSTDIEKTDDKPFAPVAPQQHAVQDIYMKYVRHLLFTRIKISQYLTRLRAESSSFRLWGLDDNGYSAPEVSMSDVITLCVQAELEFRSRMSKMVQALVRPVQRANMSKRTAGIEQGSSLRSRLLVTE